MEGSRAGAPLWQSMSWVWDSTKAKYWTGTFFPSPAQQHCTLQYTKEGSLEILYGSTRVWHSNTDSQMCGGGIAGKAVFKDGELEIRNQADDVVWNTATLGKGIGGRSSGTLADADKWGVGNNKCMQDKKGPCVTLFADYDYKPGPGERFGPGDYPNAKMGSVKDGNTYSMRVSQDHCWIEQWDYDDYKQSHVWFLEDTPTIFGPGCLGGVCITLAAQVGCDTAYSGALPYSKQTQNGWKNGGNSMKIHSTSDWQVYMMYKDGQTSSTSEGAVARNECCTGDQTNIVMRSGTMDEYETHLTRKNICSTKQLCPYQ